GPSGVTLSPAVTMTEAITALVTEKRATGYKYDAEERVLARFAAFSASQFPGLEAPTRASVEAWITSARDRGVKPATLQGLAAPVRELARWLGRRGVPAYVLPAGTLPRPARYVPHIYTDQELAGLFAQTDRCHYDSQVPFRHLVMPVLFRTIYAGGRGHGPRVHDLRHSFAVNNLRSWFARGEDAGALLPVLQTYMGHSSIADTDYYLRLTAESYPHITARIQRAYGDVVPPVTAGPGDGD